MNVSIITTTTGAVRAMLKTQFDAEGMPSPGAVAWMVACAKAIEADGWLGATARAWAFHEFNARCRQQALPHAAELPSAEWPDPEATGLALSRQQRAVAPAEDQASAGQDDAATVGYMPDNWSLFKDARQRWIDSFAERATAVGCPAARAKERGRKRFASVCRSQLHLEGPIDSTWPDAGAEAEKEAAEHQVRGSVWCDQYTMQPGSRQPALRLHAEVCATCRYWFSRWDPNEQVDHQAIEAGIQTLTEQELAGTTGQCRRHPPVLMSEQVDLGEGEPATIGSFPTTCSLVWCGEFAIRTDREYS